MIRNKFLLYPLILFLFLFLVDKIFLLDSVKSYIKTDFTYLYYETKEELFDLLVKNHKEGKLKKKLMIVLGSSRLLYFDHKELTEFYPDWDIYNFSSAVTTPAYYYYYIERILKNGIQPTLILLESDPNQFNQNSPVFKDSNLTYSFDLPFILKNANLFGKDYVSFYLGKTLFASSKNKPLIQNAFQRLKSSERQAISEMGNTVRKLLLENKGHSISLVENYYERDFGMLEATSQRTMDWLYRNYKDSEMQYTFFEYILRDVKAKNIDMIIVWPQSSIPMQKLMKSTNYVKDWQSKVGNIASKYGFSILDMDNTSDYYCNSFVDGGHISKDCYRPFIRYVMSEYYRVSQGKY